MNDIERGYWGESTQSSGGISGVSVGPGCSGPRVDEAKGKREREREREREKEKREKGGPKKKRCEQASRRGRGRGKLADR